MSETRRLGRYELLEQLGEGGMGTVWLARLTGAAGFEKLCIVKTVLPSIAKDAEFVSRFLHEGRVLTQLSHGNIAQVLDMNEADGQLFLALEYVAGVDLARLHEQVRAAQEYMPLELVVAMITQAAEGLGAAHRKAALDGSPLQVVHRDVSPHNIMVSYEGEVKVIDFGIAKSEARSRHTAQASVMGKLGYMAPEQARGEPVDHRADQFALSIVLWELLSNQQWVKRGTLTEMVVAMANPTLRPVVPLRADVPPSLEAVVLKALSPLPADRFATTDDFAQALMGELLKLGPPPTKPQLGQYVRARCSVDFAGQQQLLTRVSTQRSPPPGAEPRPKVDLFAETAVRASPAMPSSMHQQTGLPTIPGRPVNTVSQATPVTEPTPPPVPTKESVAVAAPTTESVVVPTAETVAVAALPPVDTAPLREPATVPVPVLTAVDRPAVTVRAQLPLSTGEMAVVSVRRNPAVLVLGVVAALAVGAALFFALRSPEVVKAPVEVVDAGKVMIVPEPVVIVDAGLAPELAPPPPPPEELPTLQVAGRKGGNSWIVSNQSRSKWTRCQLTLPGQRVASIGTLPRGGSVDLPLKRFGFDALAPVLEKQARVDCEQGFGVIEIP